MKNIPTSVAQCLWSYNITKLDLERDKALIIFNVLNYGTEPAVMWLMKQYTREELREVLEQSYVGAWSKKSLNFWTLLLEVSPLKKRSEVIFSYR